MFAQRYAVSAFFGFVSLLALMSVVPAQTMPVSEVVIIANSGVKAREISPEDLKAIFLEVKTSLSDGSHVKPVLSKNGPAHSAFLKEYLGKTDFALQTYYRSLVFSGKGSIPATFHSDADVLAYVAKTRDAIGYVAPGFVEDSVRTLRIK